jgi:hypothetical protein
VSSLLVTQITATVPIGKDDLCREITNILGALWTSEEFTLLNKAGLAEILTAALRSLIRLNDVTRLNNLLFLSKVIAVCPPDVISFEKSRIMDTLIRCCEFYSIENLLDTIFRVISCDDDIDSFVNMSPISLPRILTLSVHECEETRAKANVILRFMSNASDDGSIVAGLVGKFGLQEVSLLSNFFVDWSNRVERLNKHLIGLLKQLYDVGKADKGFAKEFAKKVAPILLKHCKGLTGMLQLSVFHFLRKLSSA